MKRKSKTIIELKENGKIIFTTGNALGDSIDIILREEIYSSEFKKGRITETGIFKKQILDEIKKIEDEVGETDIFVSINDTPSVHKKRILIKTNGRKIKERDITSMESLIRDSLTKKGKEVVHIIREEFSIDGKKVSTPIDERGDRFIGSFLVFTIDDKKPKLIKRILNKKLSGFFIEPLLVFYGLKASFSKNFIIVFNTNSTQIIFGRDNSPRYVDSLPLGVNDIVRDLSYILKISPRDAERLLYKDKLLDSRILKAEDYPIAIEKKVASMRFLEILEFIENRTERISFNFFPEEVVICGEGAKLKNIKEFTKKFFDLPASLGEPDEFNCELKLDNLQMISTVGGFKLVKMRETKKRGLMDSFINLMERLFD